MGRTTSLFASIASMNVISHFGLTGGLTEMATGHADGGPQAFFYSSLASAAGFVILYKAMRRMGNAI